MEELNSLTDWPAKSNWAFQIVQSEGSGRVKHTSALTCLPSRHARCKLMEKPPTVWLVFSCGACCVGYAWLISAVAPGTTKVGRPAPAAGAQPASATIATSPRSASVRDMQYLLCMGASGSCHYNNISK